MSLLHIDIVEIVTGSMTIYGKIETVKLLHKNYVKCVKLSVRRFVDYTEYTVLLKPPLTHFLLSLF